MCAMCGCTVLCTYTGIPMDVQIGFAISGSYTVWYFVRGLFGTHFYSNLNIIYHYDSFKFKIIVRKISIDTSAFYHNYTRYCICKLLGSRLRPFQTTFLPFQLKPSLFSPFPAVLFYCSMHSVPVNSFNFRTLPFSMPFVWM